MRIITSDPNAAWISDTFALGFFCHLSSNICFCHIAQDLLSNLHDYITRLLWKGHSIINPLLLYLPMMWVADLPFPFSAD